MTANALTTKRADNETLHETCRRSTGTYTCPDLLDNGEPRCSCTSSRDNTTLQIASTITIHGELFQLSDPALNLSYTDSLYSSPVWAWKGRKVDIDQLNNASRCVAADQYSWGFSASLLLTFCVWTIIYALLLLSLETEVYLFSRSQRRSRPYSTYQDVLSIAAALTARFGDNILDLPPKELDKMINRHKGSIRLQLGECPPSRVETMRYRAMVDQAAWDAKENETHELAVMAGDQNHSDGESSVQLQPMLETISRCSSPRASMSEG